jgi:hypothetical protein
MITPLVLTEQYRFDLGSELGSGVGAPSTGLSRVGLFGHVFAFAFGLWIWVVRYLMMRTKVGPTNPTLPVHQNREGWGTHFRTFGRGWATCRFSAGLDSSFSLLKQRAPPGLCVCATAG